MALDKARVPLSGQAQVAWDAPIRELDLEPVFGLQEDTVFKGPASAARGDAFTAKVIQTVASRFH